MNLRDLPDGAFTLYKGNKGKFYQAKFDLVLIFGPTLSLHFMHGDDIIAVERADYTLTTSNPLPTHTSNGLPPAPMMDAIGRF